MFASFRKEDPQLTAAISSAYKDLNTHHADSEEYAAAVDQIVKLHDLQPRQLDPNVLVTIAANFLIGAMVLKYEGTGVVTTKLWSFLSKT